MKISKIIKLKIVLININKILYIPLSDCFLNEWALSIDELEPEITPEILECIINKFINNEIKYDFDKGIQNIFKGFNIYVDTKISEGEDIIKWLEVKFKYSY